MKNEILKGKIKYLGTGSHGDDDIIFKKKDIKSAVEWLKEKVRKTRFVTMVDIDEAFEDVK